MNRLVIDAGNSRVKVAVYESDERISLTTESHLTQNLLDSLVSKFNPGAAILSSVVGLDEQVLSGIKKFLRNIILDQHTPLPFKNRYATPGTLGYDRLANVAGAHRLFPKQNVLVIDAGTCLKFDFINDHAEYIGGGISPGLVMRYKALHHYTHQLPMLQPAEDALLTGDSTIASIHSGILNGMTEEINGITGRYEKEFANVQLILTGGDARFFLNHLKKSIFATPELTLKGLHSILQYNYPNDQ